MEEKFMGTQFVFSGAVPGLTSSGVCMGDRTLEELEEKIKNNSSFDMGFWLIFELRGNTYIPLVFLNTKDKNKIIRHDLSKPCS